MAVALPTGARPRPLRLLRRRGVAFVHTAGVSRHKVGLRCAVIQLPHRCAHLWRGRAAASVASVDACASSRTGLATRPRALATERARSRNEELNEEKEKKSNQRVFY